MSDKNYSNYEARIRELELKVAELEEELNARNLQMEEMKRTLLYKVMQLIKYVKEQLIKSTGKIEVLRLLGRIYHFMKESGLKGVYRHSKVFVRTRKEEKFLKNIGEDIENGIGNGIYDSRYEENKDFSTMKTDMKPIAFFLPQFHTFPENDAWWGEGFTEWVNTRKATPRFEGHYQPRTPHGDIGYYDLSNIETLKKQAILAKQHGIYGFCFYYYWFSGKKLMEKPIDLLLNCPEIDIQFCLCWANENFTRSWDGDTRQVIMRQEYNQGDPQKFIQDIKKYIQDKRYITVDGKPVIIVYNAEQIPNVKWVFSEWRKYARQSGIGEICIWTCQTGTSAELLGTSKIIEGEVEFPPHNMRWKNLQLNDVIIQDNKNALIFNYHMLVKSMVYKITQAECYRREVPLYRCCMLGWDNAARRKDGWTTFIYYSLYDFYKWVCTIIEDTRKNNAYDSRFIFVNAWNEWAEGTYLEPDQKYGYANINTFSRAIFGQSFHDNPQNEEKR